MSKADVDKHLKKFEISQRLILINLQEMIVDEIPTATQVIKYGIPTFLIEGVAIIGFDGYDIQQHFKTTVLALATVDKGCDKT